MNKKSTSQLKDYILILMGIVISIAGIIFIVRQYSKLLSEPSFNEEGESDDRVIKKIKSHFKQIHEDEGTNPELMDDGDLSIDVE